ncbi:MAG: coproporphyrinogen III oxidase [Chloroflexota bacterium]|nr:MAG: coproporphyrinogen III oxidase [Chloroflexota bacterium]
MIWNQPSQPDQQDYPPQDIFAAGLRHHHIANTAYPINHNWTMKPYRVRRQDFEAVTAAAWQDITEMGLYVHIPFCQARCNFCEYTVINPADNARSEDSYFELLLRELAHYQSLIHTQKKILTGFDIGGGTPALAKVEHIAQVVEAAQAAFNFQPGMQISIETTPLIAANEPAKIMAFRQMGIERISMGVQVTQLSLAKKLGRLYKGFEGLREAVRNIRAAGFEKFNIDLMYGFAGQSLDDWRDSVEKGIELEADYITLYRMRYKGTGLQSQAAQVSKEIVTEMATVANHLLHEAGYVAPPGKNTYSRLPGDVGTSDYLANRVVKGTPYLGLGLGAQSLSHNTLAYNRGAGPKSIAPYEQALQAGQLPIQDLYDMPLAVSMAKMISVSFYFGEINLTHFQEKFGVALESQFPAEVEFVLAEGLMEYRRNCLSLTPAGAKVYNGVIALFYAPAAKLHLLQRPVDLGERMSAQWQRELRRSFEIKLAA